MSTVTAEYLDGIREGRHLLNALAIVDRTPETFRAYMANVQATMQTFSAGPVKDLLRGERDFWRNQLRKV
jgi:hypothetical protein